MVKCACQHKTTTFEPSCLQVGIIVLVLAKPSGEKKEKEEEGNNSTQKTNYGLIIFEEKDCD